MSNFQTNSLTGKCAIVTGAGRGIGRSIAITFASAGATVVLVARTESQIKSVLYEIEAAGGGKQCFSHWILAVNWMYLN